MTGPSSLTFVPNVTMVGAYRVLQMIGEGGMGSVYLGEHTLLGRRAAIKILHPQFSVRQDIVTRFFNEARAATTIADPGIVQVFDFGFHESIAYIVMEHLQGETLLARLRRLKRLPEADTLRISRQIALSLHAAHARGVIHRDLKPDNVFVVPDPEAVGGERTKVLDFGIAKLVDTADRQHTQTGLVLGTPSYMSPEQCRGAGSVDHRSDIYSLGCMIFRCVAGRLPFEAEGSGDLIAMHLREPAPAPSQFAPVRPELDEIVRRCLAKSPDDRYPTMHQLAVDLDQLLRSITVPPGTDLKALTPLPPAPLPLPAPAPSFPEISADIASTPTTLSSAASQTPMPSPTAAPQQRWGVIAAIAIVLISGGIGTIVAVSHGHHDDDIHATNPTPDPSPTTKPVPVPAVPVPAAIPVPAAVPVPAPVPAAPTGSADPFYPAAGSAAPAAGSAATKPKPHRPTPTKRDDLYDDR